MAGEEGEGPYHCDVGEAARPVAAARGAGTRSGPGRATARPLARRRGGGRDGRGEARSRAGRERGGEGRRRQCKCGR